MIPNCKHHRIQPRLRVIVPGPDRPDRGADGRTSSWLGRGSQQVLGGSEVKGGRMPERPSQVGGVGRNRGMGRRPSAGGEG